MSTQSHSAEAASVRAPLTGQPKLFASTGVNLMIRGPQVAFAPNDDSGAASVSDDGPLSLDDAVGLLAAADEDPAEESADDGDPDAEAEDSDEAEASADAEDEEQEAQDQEPGEDDAPEDDPASEEGAEETEDEPEAPVIEPPKFWSAEEKAAFAKAPPEVQQILAAKDAEYSRQVSLAKEEAATARKEAAVISQANEVITQAVERAETIFKGKWDGVDWAQWAKEDPQEAFAAKFEFDAEQEELQRLKTAQAATEAEEHRQFLKAERAKLAEAGHVLADPEKGPAEKKALVEYATTQGFSPTDLQWAGAKELTVLHKARLYDELQAKAVQKPIAPKPKSEPAKAAKPPGPVRPAAPPPPRKSVIHRQKSAVLQRVQETGRMEDGVKAILALGL